MASDPPDIADLARAPQRVRTDEGTVEERPIKDVIQGDVYARLDQPADPINDGTLFGIGIVSVRPPDTLGTQNRWPYNLSPRTQ